MTRWLVGSGVWRALWAGPTAAVGRRAFSSIYEEVDVFRGSAEAEQRVRIDGYDEAGFQVDGINHKGSLVCLSNLYLAWSPKTFEDITPESLALFELLRPAPEILVMGCGKKMERVGQDVRDFLRANGIRLEAVDTKNAASTFNFLNEEGRQVAAVLLPSSA